MTVPPTAPSHADAGSSKILRAAIWVAIGALIAAAIVCVLMVLIGTSNGIVPRAFLTILLMVAFSAIALLETRLAVRRPVWFALTSMVVWVVTLLIGAVMIWMPFRDDTTFFRSGGRLVAFLLIVLILQLWVLHVRIYAKAWARNRTPFTTTVAGVTVVLTALLAIMLVFPLMLSEWVHFFDLYWRLVVAVAILAAVGSALLPLVNALFAPRRSAAAVAPAWPTYADGVTPLPMRPDGTPDWDAYRAGHPSAAAAAPVAAPVWAAPEVPPAIAPEHTWPAPAGAPAWPAPVPAAWPSRDVPPRPPLPPVVQPIPPARAADTPSADLAEAAPPSDQAEAAPSSDPA